VASFTLRYIHIANIKDPLQTFHNQSFKNLITSFEKMKLKYANRTSGKDVFSVLFKVCSVSTLMTLNAKPHNQFG
jgi:hypothetical protein